MSAPSAKEVIRIEGVSKRYRLGEIDRRTLVEDVARLGAKLRGKPDPTRKIVGDAAGDTRSTHAGGAGEYVWALRHVDLAVTEGEVVALIGRNGAGKSTLLKLLSRITLPTEGVIKARGRIASLLEIGTGFHPDLTGRDNVYLNGAILGMRRHEVSARLDEIVDFAGVARYLDTPVKRYSSGMVVRLAFAVAAHLDCEILVVDEVLAVGDNEFQRKCIGKMQEVAEHGARTVLFVSHNMGIVSALCDRGVVLDEGRVIFDGETRDAIARYDQQIRERSTQRLADRMDRGGLGGLRVRSVEIVGDSHEGVPAPPACGGPARIRLEYETPRGALHEKVVFSVIASALGNPLMVLATDMTGDHWPEPHERGFIEFEVPRLPLKRGEYSLEIRVESHSGLQDQIDGAVYFEVAEGNFYGTGRHGYRFPNTPLVEYRWEHRPGGDHSGH